MAKVIGFAGPANVGKSTTTKNIKNSFKKLYPELKVESVAFADPIYKIVSDITHLPISLLKSQEYKNITWVEETAPLPCLIGYSPRSFLQKVGTEMFRVMIHYDIWIQSSLAKFKDYDIIITEDARFSNEFSYADLVIELYREGVVYEMNHPSAMPPDEKYIDLKIEVYKNMNYNIIANELYDRLLGD